VHYTAWAARTLLEIRLFAEYVTSSNENMHRFSQDFFVEGARALSVTSKVLDKIPDDPSTPIGKEFLEQSIPLVKTHSDAADVSELEAILASGPSRNHWDMKRSIKCRTCSCRSLRMPLRVAFARAAGMQ
jgi:hypothetical protein